MFGVVHLLIYVVRADKSTSSNFRFFYDSLCQQDTPIILVQTTHTPSELSWFNLVPTLDGADPESDKVNLHKAITKHLNRNPKSIPHIERFESAVRGGCWRKKLAGLLQTSAMPSRLFSRTVKRDGDTRCGRIIESYQMILNKQCAKTET